MRWWAVDPVRGQSERAAAGGVSSPSSTGSPAAVSGSITTPTSIITSSPTPTPTASGLSQPPARRHKRDVNLASPPAGADGPAGSSGSTSGGGSGTTTRGGSGAGSQAALTAELASAFRALPPQAASILSIRTNVLLYAQALFGTIPWSVISVFLPDYLAQEQGFTVLHATFLVLMFGIGAIVGGIAGGVLGNAIFKSGSPQRVPLIFGALQACSTLPMLWLINMPPLTPEASHSLLPVYVVAACAGACASLTGPNLKAMLLNVNAPATRGAVLTFAYLFDSLSKGIVPYVIGVVISIIGQRTLTFTVAMLGWVMSGLLISLVSLSIVHDETMMKAKSGSSGGSSASSPRSADAASTNCAGGSNSSIGSSAAGS
ncbi:MAG: hypothetical protein EOO41_04730 [Methanobacteriota archaeon]|nr:MAG: hypothetical protein EOO41_04730 [Euryarchaeota archaeon]